MERCVEGSRIHCETPITVRADRLAAHPRMVAKGLALFTRTRLFYHLQQQEGVFNGFSD